MSKRTLGCSEPYEYMKIGLSMEVKHNGHKRLLCLSCLVGKGILPASLSAYCWLAPPWQSCLRGRIFPCPVEPKPWSICLESVLRLGQEKPARTSSGFYASQYAQLNQKACLLLELGLGNLLGTLLSNRSVT